MAKLLIRLSSFLCLLSAGCGGGNSGSPPPGPPAPTSGIYLFEGNAGSSLNLTTVDSKTGALGSTTLAGSQADDSTSYPGVAILPSRKFLYALFTSFTVIQGFQVSGPGLQLAVLKDAPFFPSASAGPFNSSALHPSGKFLYVIESPATIEEFSVDAITGDLTHASAVTETADLRVATIDPTGKFLFANDLTGGRIFGYQIDPVSGALTAVANSPFAVPANGQPILDVLDSSGKFLYAALFSGGVAAFVVDGTTGALANVPGSPFPTTNVPSCIAADPSAGFIYVCNFTDGSIDGFAVNTNSGALSKVAGSPFGTAPSPTNIVVDPTGTFVYVSTYQNSMIYGFSLDASTGSLSALNASPFPSVPNPTNLMILKIP